jgi:hypothetical protein
MTAETDEADRLLNRAVVALFGSAKLGNARARHLFLVATARRSPGRPPHDDADDLAAIEAGETLSAVAARQSAATGQRYESVRHRRWLKIRTKAIRNAA